MTESLCLSAMTQTCLFVWWLVCLQNNHDDPVRPALCLLPVFAGYRKDLFVAHVQGAILAKMSGLFYISEYRFHPAVAGGRSESREQPREIKEK